jgi:amino acid adenylation domain-containing protein
MRDFRQIAAKAEIVANQNIREKKYWLKQLSGISTQSRFPYDQNPTGRVTASAKTAPAHLDFRFSDELFADLMKLSNHSDPKLHMILLAGLSVLLYKFTGSQDIVVGIPVYKQEIEGEFINTALAFRARLKDHQSFKELLLLVRRTMVEADENQDYPIEILVKQLHLPFDDGNGFPLFEMGLLLDNIHDRRYVQHLGLNMVYAFLRRDSGITGQVVYNPSLYREASVQRIVLYFQSLLENALRDVDTTLADVEMLPPAEKERLLVQFNDTEAEYPGHKTIQALFEEQAAKTPEHTAIVGADGLPPLSYRELNRQANQLARILRESGVQIGVIVAVMLDRSPRIVVALLAILKAGGVYLPIDVGTPLQRVLFLLNDSAAPLLLADSRSIEDMPYSALSGFESRQDVEPVLTSRRHYIREFDQLPIPDRSLIDLRNYRNKIGMASVTNCISLQATRGCPYECLFCHKIWAKTHIYRSARNIYSEIEYFYKNGVRNFAFIDDCFNLNRQKSSRVFELIIQNGLRLQIFFPNGLRGDIMTPDYIDLMVEAGTRGINLSLETASPRLQRLIKKNLDLDKFKKVVDYIARQHPEIILEMATMHGLPTETEEEAMMTLAFIKDVRWLHFPYIHILKIFPNTEMEAFALARGVAREDIMISKDRAFHELPETLPFPKSFTRQYQADFMNNYFLNRERLRQVLPVEMNILSEVALCQKYNAYLPVDIQSIDDIVTFAGLEDVAIPGHYRSQAQEEPTIFDRGAVIRQSQPAAKKILLLDLSQHFSSHRMLYRVVEQPLGLIYLLTYLKERFGERIDGRIYKSGNDFDDFDELRELVESYRPHLIGLRTLTFFKEFFHQTVSRLRQWGFTGPIIGGGPYASSDYDTILKDDNVDLVVLGEGEYTLAELMEAMMTIPGDGLQLPPAPVLDKIDGIVYARRAEQDSVSRQVLLMDQLAGRLKEQSAENLRVKTQGSDLAYVIYTSGSTGRPKGVMVEHRQVNNCIFWMQDLFRLDEGDVIVNRTALTFDPSVWEIFWPLYIGGGVRVLGEQQSKDVNFLLDLLADRGYTMMYCPATLVEAMTHVLKQQSARKRLTLPWLIIGAEPIEVKTVKDFYAFYEGRIVNTYGPTECTINNTYYDIERDDPRPLVPIGKPVANNRIYIASPARQLLPVGVAGEICIGGESVARGYLNKPDLTAAGFCPDPFITPAANDSPVLNRMYRSGDVGRWLEDGNVEILGRVDEQVKIRGYRMELGEIEAALKRHPAVGDGLVLLKDRKEAWAGGASCRRCGITVSYPGVRVNTDGICSLCENFQVYKKTIDAYFRTLPDLQALLERENRQKRSKYDCLLLYAGGRGAGYALYRLADMGFRVLALTFDNGYFGKGDLENIKKITSRLGVDHVVLTHPNTDQILRESIKVAGTVCRGCFHTSSSLAVEYAYRHHIKVVVGATLSRGQIIENRLFMFLEQGIMEVPALEQEILKLQKMAPQIDEGIFNYIDIDVVQDGSIHERVKFVDFYRYCDIGNEEMIDYLDNRDSLWKSRKSYAVFSTNCPIKQIGDYAHLRERGYHYYGSATSWERRLGHLTLENLKEDLSCRVSHRGYENFLRRLGIAADKEAGEADKYLCAYYVPVHDNGGREVEVEELRDFLDQQLPVYMIPSHFVRLDQIPLTANGKIDRRALPQPEMRAAAEYVAPRNELEMRLAAVWSEVLGREKETIGINDNFFELGGQSLKATIMTAHIHREFGVHLTLTEIFQMPTIGEMAAYLKEANRENYLALEVAEDREYYPLSSAQKRLYILQQMEPESTAYNMPLGFVLQGSLDKSRLQEAFAGLIGRHECLRTSFEMVDKDPVQKIHRAVNFEVEYGKYPSMEEGVRDFVRPFDLSKPPLLRVGLSTGGEGYLLMVDMHHIVSDAVSHGIMENEFMALYAGQTLADFKIRYRDYAQWQNRQIRSGEMKRQEDFWLETFKGEIPVINLPTDYARAEVQSTAADQVAFEIEGETVDRLRQVARDQEATMFMVFLALFNIFLARLCGQEDMVVGTAVAGRRHADLGRIIGMFVNTLALRNYPQGDKTFTAFLQEVRTRTLDAYDNQDYQFEDLVQKVLARRETGRNPLFDVLFSFISLNRESTAAAPAGPEVEIPGLHIERYGDGSQEAKFDLMMIGLDEGGPKGASFTLRYRTGLFKRETIENLIGCFKEVVSAAAANFNIPLKDIHMSHDLGVARAETVMDSDEDFGF